MEFLSNLIKDLFWVVISNVIILLIIFVPIILAMITNNHAKNNIKTEQKARRRKNFYIACFSVVLILIIIVFAKFVIELNRPSTFTNPMQEYTNLEKEAFNNQFESYNNIQAGSQVNRLISIVNSNAQTNRDDPQKIPSVVFFKDNETNSGEVIFDTKVSYDNSTDINEYTKAVSNIRKNINSREKYYVKCERSSENGLVDTIIIVQIPTQNDYYSERVIEKMEQLIENNRNYFKGE